MRENGQSLTIVKTVKAGKQMKGRDQSRAQSMAQNGFVEKKCLMEGAFPNHEMVKG